MFVLDFDRRRGTALAGFEKGMNVTGGSPQGKGIKTEHQTQRNAEQKIGSCSQVADSVGVTGSHPDTYAWLSVKREHEPIFLFWPHQVNA